MKWHDQSLVYDQQCADAWWANFDLTKVDLAKLPHRQVVADYMSPPYTTLAQAVKAATVIVVAHVTSIGKGRYVGTLVDHLAVEQTLKGVVGTNVDLVGEEPITLGIRPVEEPIGSQVAIQDSAAGFPLPGERMLIFGSMKNGELVPEVFGGTYFLDCTNTSTAAQSSDCRGVAPNVGNPFSDSIWGLTETKFMSQVKTLIGSAT